MKRLVRAAATVCALAASIGVAGEQLSPIIVYHRFGPTASDSMTVRTAAFAAQLEVLKQSGIVVVPLRRLVERLNGGTEPLPTKAVVITVDDGHRSVYTEMLPLVRRYGVPVTLFIYPSAISNASYALTWKELEELRQSGLFDIQAHTYWHPNFKEEKQRLRPEAYRAFVRVQLSKPRQVLEERLGGTVDLLAWPFGIYDDELIAAAIDAGFIAGFTLEGRPPSSADRPLALPRHLMTDAVGMPEFLRLVGALTRARR